MSTAQTIPRFAVPYGMRDYLTAIGSMFHQRPRPPEGLGKLFGTGKAFWTASGRQALWLILRGLNLPPRSGVAVPLYCDSSVHTAVRKAGFNPVFVDVDERTLTLDPAMLARVRDRVSAIVVCHYFGHVAMLDDLSEVAAGIPIIEDTAHAPLSLFGNQAVGGLGVASFFSFASTKYLPASGGGLAVINDRELAGRIAGDVAGLTPPAFLEELRRATGQIAKAVVFRRPFYGLFGMSMRAKAERRRLLEPCFTSQAIQRSQAAVALRRATLFPERVERQRLNSLRLLSHLSGTEGVVLPVERPGVRYNYHLFPVLLRDGEECEAVRRRMREREVDTSRIHFDVVEQARKLGYRGGCPVSESAAARMLTLPNYADLSGADVDRVASVFLDSLNSCRMSKRRTGGNAVRPRELSQEVTVK